MSINEFLKTTRKNHNLSVRNLSELIQMQYGYYVSKSTLNYIEQPGKAVDAKTLFILIDFYHLDFQEVKEIILDRN
ncbi:helix-turn-helix domain-containing protein [Bombilactobacillus bombi]|uniref:helix-turn-helix domain-containing protein n=1 Tax=Bombilactobacillus bombi TaxID=1303590 RepID=UPI0015E59D44|nr:helix-turn-helix transcriptional regulator [Bombilactobacillus bombi]MBA1434476.1 XRE family transcriptional regulator [Bombilactobacillus bombi]